MSASNVSDAAVAAAEELRRLLIKYEVNCQADFLAEALLFAEHDEEFVRRMASGDVWGSAGSVDDVALEALPGQRHAELESDWDRWTGASLPSRKPSSMPG